VSFLLIGYLALHLEWRVTLDALKEANALYYVFSTLLLLILVCLNSFKFSLLIKGTSINKSMWFLVKVNFISRFYALFLPSGVGRGAVRWYKVTENKKNRTLFLAVTLFERLMHVLLLLLVGFIPLFIYSSNGEIATLRTNIWPIMIVLIAGASIGMAYFLSPSSQEFLKGKALRFLPAPGKGKSITEFLDKCTVTHLSRPVFLFVLLTSFLWVVVFTFRVFLLSVSLGLPLHYIDLAWMSSLVLLLQLIPISFAGIGIREGAYAYLATVLGLSPEKGIVLGLLFFSQMLIVAFIGGLLELTEK